MVSRPLLGLRGAGEESHFALFALGFGIRLGLVELGLGTLGLASYGISTI